jgi:hypothetical protein
MSRKSRGGNKDLFEVEKILGERTVDGIKYYKLKWKGYPITKATFEPADSLAVGAEDLIRQWEESKPARNTRSSSKSRSVSPSSKTKSRSVSPSVKASPSKRGRPRRTSSISSSEVLSSPTGERVRRRKSATPRSKNVFEKEAPSDSEDVTLLKPPTEKTDEDFATDARIQKSRSPSPMRTPLKSPGKRNVLEDTLELPPSASASEFSSALESRLTKLRDEVEEDVAVEQEDFVEPKTPEAEETEVRGTPTKRSDTSVARDIHTEKFFTSFWRENYAFTPKKYSSIVAKQETSRLEPVEEVEEVVEEQVVQEPETIESIDSREASSEPISSSLETPLEKMPSRATNVFRTVFIIGVAVVVFAVLYPRFQTPAV